MSFSLFDLWILNMAFTESERTALLALKGVGPTVVKRFEEIGIDSFSELASHEPSEIAEMVASMLGTTCWKNSPQALSAVGLAIDIARHSRRMSDVK
ncbi:helix-hairpin-helix domain-containing protein [Franzmannia pantelleriensis]|uniref:helix-hairpin-helix domain-containing protein n=1 Tax=Franzmannia pantelleriensis TaxID=48727 RepID=UPI001FE03C58|nr:helix-hairpin-helix domain-containing protein [Halomonas pantelleriensis]